MFILTINNVYFSDTTVFLCVYFWPEKWLIIINDKPVGQETLTNKEFLLELRECLPGILENHATSFLYFMRAASCRIKNRVMLKMSMEKATQVHGERLSNSIQSESKKNNQGS